MSKKKTFYNNTFEKCVRSLNNKYYNLFRRQIKVNGLDYRQEEYLMRKLYGKGTIAAFKIKNLDDIGFANWCMNTRDMYGSPETVTLVNEFSSPVIPTRPQRVDEQVVLGWINKSRASGSGNPIYSISEDVNWYIERIAQVEVTIDINLQLHKMPFLIPIDENQDKAKDIVDKILNGDLVIFTEGFDPATFKAVLTGAPYLIDKLYEYKLSLENELKTLLGIDNQGHQNREQQNLDTTNANNCEINDSIELMIDSLNEFADRVRETLGYDMSFERVNKPVEAIGEFHEGEQPGPDGGNEDE